jgi:hypothetical protein
VRRAVASKPAANAERETRERRSRGRDLAPPPYGVGAVDRGRASGAGVFEGARVGAANEPAEAQAHQVAERVMRMPSAAAGSALPARSEGAGEPTLRRQETGAAASEPRSSGLDRNRDVGSAGTALHALGAGRPLPDAERAFFEPRFGHSLAHVRIHDGPSADHAAGALAARAFTLGSHVAFAHGEWRPGSAEGRQLLAHELAHVEQAQAGGGASIRRALKFELQVKRNFIHAWDGKSSLWSLPRKFGPADYLVEDASGTRLETETGGQVEFETEWERKWPDLEAQLAKAKQMVDEMKAAPEVEIGGVTYKKFPFAIDHLRKGKWKAPRGKSFEDNSSPGHPDRALSRKQELVVEEKDPAWNAYIQTSESFRLDQFQSFFDEYESNTYDPSEPGTPRAKITSADDISDKVIASADRILTEINTAKLPDTSIVGLRNFLTMVISYILRGQYPATSPVGEATKFAFSTMSRTHFGSIHAELLSADEQALFASFVKDCDKLLLSRLGLTSTSKFFVHGQGTKAGAINPTIGAWLESIAKGKDLLSSRESSGKLSGSMGRFKVGEETGKHEGLIRYEVRRTPGNSAPASDWVSHAKDRFESAHRLRNRSGSTRLKM